MELAIFWRRIVLPALGGEVMRPRCPIPTGVTRSITRPVHILHLQERQVALTLLRRTDLPQNSISGAEIESLDLGGTDVDVVRPVQVIPILGPQEPVSFREDLEHPLSSQHNVAVQEILLDPEDQVLLAEAGVVGNVELFRELMEVCYALTL
jgi:hypothetical protein